MKNQSTLLGCALVVTCMVSGCAREDTPSSPMRVAQVPATWITEATMRVDRMGMPAIATAVITSKDEYNAADPVDDAIGLFVDEIVANIAALHAALDDDLISVGLAPCATGDCVNQAAPLVVPDVIRIDPSQPSGFPNGRRLTDPVIDVTLALVLLDLAQHDVTTLVGLNPSANDKAFLDEFPFLHPPHRGMGRTRSD